MNNPNEQIVTLTEQGNYGLGIGNVTDEKERQELQRRLNEMQNQTNRQQGQRQN